MSSCDTAVAVGSAAAHGGTLFLKNSDRDPNEAAAVVVVPAADHAPGSVVRCTYREVPQVGHTHAMVLCKPAWMWGAEMGANEHGVSIGNEALWSRTPVPAAKEHLLGMDYLRLALERATSARGALDVVTTLLEEYGQGGEAGFDRHLVYHNGFLFADGKEAWVLETVGRAWAAERVRNGLRTISNRLSIGGEFDLSSPGLVDDAVAAGRCSGAHDFVFREAYGGDWLRDTLGKGYERRCASAARLSAHGPASVTDAFAALRDHSVRGGCMPDRGMLGVDVCMHAGGPPVRVSQTTGSMVSVIPRGATSSKGIVHWVTGTSAPCLSVFRPLSLDAALDRAASEAARGADGGDAAWNRGCLFGPAPHGGPKAQWDGGASLWWRFEVLHRNCLLDWPARALAVVAPARDELERAFIEEVERVAGRARRSPRGGSGGDDGDQQDARFAQLLGEVARDCEERADEHLDIVTQRVCDVPARRRAPWLYRREWMALNARCGIAPWVRASPGEPPGRLFTAAALRSDAVQVLSLLLALASLALLRLLHLRATRGSTAAVSCGSGVPLTDLPVPELCCDALGIPGGSDAAHEVDMLAMDVAAPGPVARALLGVVVVAAVRHIAARGTSNWGV